MVTCVFVGITTESTTLCQTANVTQFVQVIWFIPVEGYGGMRYLALVCLFNFNTKATSIYVPFDSKFVTESEESTF